MVRDFALIRRILLEVQSIPAGSPLQHVSFPGEYNQVDVDEHVALLIEAGLLRGVSQRPVRGTITVMVSDMTWDGHDFLASIADDGLWQKAVDTVLKPSAEMAFDVLKAWLKAQALEKLGIS